MKNRVSIHLFATLAKFTPVNAENYPVAPGSSVQDLLVELDVPLEEVKLIFINGIKGELSSIVQDGDRIGVFPPIGGG